MKTLYMKLAASLLSILIAVTLISGATFAWFSFSASPEIRGINVSIGGSKTIMLAPDFMATVKDENGNEVLIHYPGQFDNSLNFAEYEAYDYLNEISSLSPVSTSNGLYWVFPTYDEESGALNDISEFEVDQTLEHSNGAYAYLDFWILAPGSEYDIHIATDINSKTGTYLIELPGVEEAEKGKLQLADTQGIIGNIARVGFLINTDDAGETALNAYTGNGTQNTQYKSLQGIYQEPGEAVDLGLQYQFTIYEPNATSHVPQIAADGTYIATYPLWYNPYGNTILEEDVSKILTAQTANQWKNYGEKPLIDQIFQTAIANKRALTPESAASYFYDDYLQGQIDTYVETGEFFKSTANLYSMAQTGMVSETAGATDDVALTKLKGNTPQRVRMFIWLEGQDVDCANEASVSESGFSLNIKLSGANE